ncbi:ATP-binding cassette domain-containing protein [Candidatus Phytoplasma pruni]|uniref:ATP-binding cassette domain-containing protein n=1 Tax=Candidatus Phytoplasma pruni TaxID=479893 RepID=A0A851H9E3_9MOLU|nr:ATP-binding cassette domain-containing protein [Candidatus Phytoplasma pruni]NWN45552.1 ATP-binding cassette domain-containing protein [Candidatus Phytoplasma pruni]
MLKLINISKTYKNKNTILHNINLTLPHKGMVFIVGKSGSGKTTLMNILGGLDNYNEGEIIFKNKSTKKFRQKDFDAFRNSSVGFIFQDYSLLPELSVFENISIALELQRKKADPQMVEDILTKIGLDNFAHRKINELSGGQKQRISIARALIKNPEIIMGDEPTGALDSKTGKQIIEILKKLSKEKLIIIVSHDLNFAHKYADRIIEIKDGQIIKDEIKTVLNPENEVLVNNEYKPIYSFLPFKRSFKFALNAVKHKPANLFFNILLSAFALIFLGVALSFASFNKRDIIKRSFAKKDPHIPLIVDINDEKTADNLINNNPSAQFKKVYQLRYNFTDYKGKYKLTNNLTPLEEYILTLLNLFSTPLPKPTQLREQIQAQNQALENAPVSDYDPQRKVTLVRVIEYDPQNDAFLKELGLKVVPKKDASEAVPNTKGPEKTHKILISRYLKDNVLKQYLEQNKIDNYGLFEFESDEERFESVKNLTPAETKEMYDNPIINVVKITLHNLYKLFKTEGLENMVFVSKDFIQKNAENLYINKLIGNLQKIEEQDLDSIINTHYSRHTLSSIPMVLFIDAVEPLFEMITLLFVFLSINYTIFSIVLMFNFISSSVQSKKKEIGILRAIGASSFDVIMIFMQEILIIALMIFLIAVLAIKTVICYGNQVISSLVWVDIVEFGAKEILYVGLITFIVSFVSGLGQTLRIAHKKPIEAMR